VIKIEKELETLNKLREALDEIYEIKVCAEYYELSKECENKIDKELNKLDVAIETIENIKSDKEYVFLEEDD